MSSFGNIVRSQTTEEQGYIPAFFSPSNSFLNIEKKKKKIPEIFSSKKCAFFSLFVGLVYNCIFCVLIVVYNRETEDRNSNYSNYINYRNAPSPSEINLSHLSLTYNSSLNFYTKKKLTYIDSSCECLRRWNWGVAGGVGLCSIFDVFFFFLQIFLFPEKKKKVQTEKINIEISDINNNNDNINNEDETNDHNSNDTNNTNIPNTTPNNIDKISPKNTNNTNNENNTNIANNEKIAINPNNTNNPSTNTFSATHFNPSTNLYNDIKNEKCAFFVLFLRLILDFLTALTLSIGLSVAYKNANLDNCGKIRYVDLAFLICEWSLIGICCGSHAGIIMYLLACKRKKEDWSKDREINNEDIEKVYKWN